MEKYLEEELDTIRQAFQIRLSQMEKRYQRQLASMSQQGELLRPAQPSPSSRSTPQHAVVQRRASWNGSDTSDAAVKQFSTPMKLNFDSGSDESLSSCASSNCSSVAPFTPSSDNESSTSEQTLSSVDEETISRQLKAYKSKMMDVMMAEAESRMSQMEEQYRLKVKEMNKVAVPPAIHLTHLGGVSKQPPETFV